MAVMQTSEENQQMGANVPASHPIPARKSQHVAHRTNLWCDRRQTRKVGSVRAELRLRVRNGNAAARMRHGQKTIERRNG
jgi:hypothetical protein